MAKKVRFKNPDSTLNFDGRVIGPHNISLEIYAELIKVAPSHEDLFVIEEDKETPKASKGSSTE